MLLFGNLQGIPIRGIRILLRELLLLLLRKTKKDVTNYKVINDCAKFRF